jgi:hypothetical protein
MEQTGERTYKERSTVVSGERSPTVSPIGRSPEEENLERATRS